jgi:hypothetical protein
LRRFNSSHIEAIHPPKGWYYSTGGQTKDRINGLFSDVHMNGQKACSM